MQQYCLQGESTLRVKSSAVVHCFILLSIPTTHAPSGCCHHCCRCCCPCCLLHFLPPSKSELLVVLKQPEGLEGPTHISLITDNANHLVMHWGTCKPGGTMSQSRGLLHTGRSLLCCGCCAAATCTSFMWPARLKLTHTFTTCDASPACCTSLLHAAPACTNSFYCRFALRTSYPNHYITELNRRLSRLAARGQDAASNRHRRAGRWCCLRD